MKMESIEGKEAGKYSPLVSIIIPAYRAANYLAEAIDSALCQTYKNIEVIVVNDGSPDDGATREVALRYGDRIRYFEKENGGSSSALNYGISMMRGEWFSWLSHDDLYLPDKVQTQIEFLRGQKDSVERFVLFSGSELIDAKGNVIRAYNPQVEKNKAEKVNAFVNNHWLIADQIKSYAFHGCSCLVHRNVFDEIGKFDESLRLVNDIDLWLRIFVGGYAIRYMPECLVQGRIHAKQVSKEIGFSYHNPEQDRYWKQVYDHLLTLKHDVEWKDFMLSYAITAMQKTRVCEGKMAFNILKSSFPTNKLKYMLLQCVCLVNGQLRDVAKRFYVKFLLK